MVEYNNEQYNKVTVSGFTINYIFSANLKLYTKYKQFLQDLTDHYS